MQREIIQQSNKNRAQPRGGEGRGGEAHTDSVDTIKIPGCHTTIPSSSLSLGRCPAVSYMLHLDGCGGAALKLDKDVGRVNGFRGVGVLELQDALVHVARAGRVDAHRLVRAAGPHEPAGDVQVVDGFETTNRIEKPRTVLVMAAGRKRAGDGKGLGLP